MISKKLHAFHLNTDRALDMRVSIFSIGFSDLPSGGPWCFEFFYIMKRVCIKARILCELATIAIFDLLPAFVIYT